MRNLINQASLKSLPAFGEQWEQSKTAKVCLKIFTDINFGLKPFYFGPNKQPNELKQTLKHWEKSSDKSISVEKPVKTVKIKSFLNVTVKKMSGTKDDSQS